MKENQKEPIRVALGNGEKMVFCHVPAGSFRMGERGKDPREEPVTEVYLEEFWMGETPVTRGQYRAIARECLEELEAIDGFKGIKPKVIKGDEDRRRPVTDVSWEEARVIGRWLTREMKRQKKLPNGMRVDLPTEAQWEKGCRAGTSTDYYGGDGEAALEEVGWFDGDWDGEPDPVRSKPANRWGFSDCHGSVWQWCLDPWDGKEASSRIRLPGEGEIIGVTDEAYRVLRGGSWNDSASNCRSAFRFGYWPGNRLRGFGFRLGLFPGPVQSEGPQAREETESRNEPEGGTPDETSGGDGVDGWDDLRGPEVDRDRR